MDITLKHPVKLATGQMLAKITLRRPKVRDLKAAQRVSDKPEEQELALIAALAGLTPEDIEELDLADYKAIAESFRGMLDQP
ncbi:phage tail assembly protein [Pelomicrobium methylotrophicum]|uniref:Phage tail assembly protein n=1 Tax=Pelomicrobium methylotrophicum TaxID=2602750 RepID=A0A5C7EUK8_9PROT|nr:phage tail assembly protein [Pelomicrobium methylotrophicum]TXF11932.1 phage tail assembly protein [Pelomicrobium methylotrophicum]